MTHLLRRRPSALHHANTRMQAMIFAVELEAMRMDRAGLPAHAASLRAIVAKAAPSPAQPEQPQPRHWLGPALAFGVASWIGMAAIAAWALWGRS